MSSAEPVVQSGTFVNVGEGYRFRIVTGPEHGRLRGTVVFAPAFAEEMNKSRRMAARMARMLGAHAWRVVQRDLAGCGDSSGEFEAATWNDWVADITDELQHADHQLPVWLWCERAGALLASEAIARFPDLNLLLWQPVLSGAQHLQQFLRLHAGARIVGSVKGSEPSPLQRLRAGESVEVGGYVLNPILAAGLEHASLDLAPEYSGRVEWFEVSAAESPSMSPAAERVVANWRHKGLTVGNNVIAGPLFWQTQEIEECEALLEASLAALERHDASTSLQLARDAQRSSHPMHGRQP